MSLSLTNGFVAAAVATALLVGSHSAAGKDRWHRVTTPSFVVVGNVGEKGTRRVAKELEQIRLVFQTALPRTRTREVPLLVLAVEKEKHLKELLPGIWERKDSMRPAGVFRRGGFQRAIALIASPRSTERSYRLVFHEYFHYLANLNTPGLPTWLNEGLASYWEMTDVREDSVVVGVPHDRHVSTLRARAPLPMAEFLVSRPLDSDRRDVPLFYAQSWALTHYLLIGNRQARSESLNRYIARIQEGADHVEAAEAAFGDLDALEEALRHYARKLTFTAMSIEHSSAIDVSTFDTLELSEPEALAYRGRFIVGGGRPEKAEKLLKKALKESPDEARALEAMAILEMRRGEQDEAARWLKRAVDTGRAGPVAEVLHAARQDDPELKERHLLAALSADRGFAPAFVELTYAYAAKDSTMERALVMARNAAENEPSSAENRLLVARALAQTGEVEEAREHVALSVRLAVSNLHGAESNNVCWYGSLAGFAADVMEACDFAVAQRPDYAGYRDSRGLARALVGDRAGAIEDFRSYVDADTSEDDQAILRRDWIRAMENGLDPFDEETLSALRGRPF